MAVAQSPVFIVGASRSGTGLLRDLLRSHPSLTFPGESQFIPAFYRGHGHPRSDRQARALARRMLALSWIRTGFSPTPELSAFAGARSFQDLIARLYEEVARAEGKPRWGDKTPRYTGEIPTLLELFPEGRVLHIYRDGRDVALSMRRRRFAQNLFMAATLWSRRVCRARDDGRRFPANYAEVGYEALLANPEETMRAVCAFIGEPYTDRVLRPTRPRAVAPAGRAALIGRREPPRVASLTEIDPTNTGHWRSMPVADRALFESVAGDLLAELGYETEGLAGPIPIPRRAVYHLHDRGRVVLHKLNHRDKRVTTHLLMLEARARARARAPGASVRMPRSPGSHPGPERL
jgi:hypothetical protein